MAVAAMGVFPAMKAMAFDNARKTPPLHRTDDIDAFAYFKKIQIKGLAGIVRFRVVDRDLPQIGETILSGFFEMSLKGLVNTRWLFGAEPQLESVIPIRRLGLHLCDDTRSHLKYRDRYIVAVRCKNARHA
jgi:hypothetical protein